MSHFCHLWKFFKIKKPPVWEEISLTESCHMLVEDVESPVFSQQYSVALSPYGFKDAKNVRTSLVSVNVIPFPLPSCPKKIVNHFGDFQAVLSSLWLNWFTLYITHTPVHQCGRHIKITGAITPQAAVENQNPAVVRRRKTYTEWKSTYSEPLW